MLEEGRNAFKILIDKSTGNRPHGGPRWEDDIRMDFKGIGDKTRI